MQLPQGACSTYAFHKPVTFVHTDIRPWVTAAAVVAAAAAAATSITSLYLDKWVVLYILQSRNSSRT
jgi:hypothetical protein